MSLPLKPPFTVCARGDVLAAPLYDGNDVLATTLHDRHGDAYGLVGCNMSRTNQAWALSAPGDDMWPQWQAAGRAVEILPAGGPGRIRLLRKGADALVLDDVQCIEFHGGAGQLEALAHRVLSADTWAFTARNEPDWRSALSRFGYIGDL